MKILFLTRYDRLGASSRIRSYQYYSYLESCGIELMVSPLLTGDYLKLLYEKNKMNILPIVVGYLRRIGVLLLERKFDLIWIEKELFPWIPAWLEAVIFWNVPYVTDYDDAVFHNYDLHKNSFLASIFGRKIDRIMMHSALVIVGNKYIADRAFKAGAHRVEILPSVIDLERDRIFDSPVNEIFTIGWIGSPSTAKHLLEVETALKEVCKNRGGKVVLIGTRGNPLNGLMATIRDWDESTESMEIGNFDVGIMPLPDNPWERGKCGFKLIQYMACGKPVVASPVGMNREIVVDGVNGFLASSHDEWVRALKRLKSDPELRKTMGANGRRMVEEKYCLQVTAPRLHRLFLEAAGRT